MNGEMIALGTVKTFNDLSERAAARGAETVQLIWKAGETASAAKKALPHGDWEQFVDKHYNVTVRTVRRWIKFHETVPERALSKVTNIDAALTMVRPPTKKAKRTSASDLVSTQERGKRTSASDLVSTQEREEEGEEAAEETLDKCPVCASQDWVDYGDGWECSKCRHPYGEPAGDTDGDRLATQRSKTIKTVEALMRAFDDLQHICPHSRHENVIVTCKVLLEAAREWK